MKQNITVNRVTIDMITYVIFLFFLILIIQLHHRYLYSQGLKVGGDIFTVGSFLFLIIYSLLYFALLSFLVIRAVLSYKKEKKQFLFARSLFSVVFLICLIVIMKFQKPNFYYFIIGFRDQVHQKINFCEIRAWKSEIDKTTPELEGIDKDYWPSSINQLAPNVVWLEKTDDITLIEMKWVVQLAIGVL